MVFGDYHQRTEDNDYRETRTIHDDFGKDLYGYDYTQQEWNDDLCFMLQCCRFYMQMSAIGVKIMPPMKNIITRKLKADMGDSFEEWATGYFSKESGRLDCELVKNSVIEDMRRDVPSLSKVTPQRFIAKLTAFVELSDYIAELNPKELWNSSGRIQRKKDGVTCDILYLRSAQQAVATSGETDADKPDVPF